MDTRFSTSLFKKFFSIREIQYRNQKFRKIVNSSSILVLSSKDSRRDLEKFYVKKENVLCLTLELLNKEWLKEDPIEIVKI